MTCSQNLLKVFFTLSLLSCAASVGEQAPQLSLWGKVMDLTFPCSHWILKRQVSIPALKEFTVCLNVQLQAHDSSPWTAFMYRHPDNQSAELGLGGKRGQLVVWLLGMEFITAKRLDPKRWYALCLTWSHNKHRPALYVDGNLVNFVSAEDLDISNPSSPSCCQLAPNGTLTLGASHMLVNGKPEIIQFTSLWGKVSLFRLWGHERSKEEVMSLHCTEGDLVKWEQHNWDTQTCDPVPDRSLKCEWSIYKVRLLFAIFRDDGNTTELYTARDIAHNWLRKVLPNSIYLHRVSVFEAYRLRAGTSIIKPSHEERLVRWVPDNISRFNCLVHISVIPSLDVAYVQDAMHKHLSVPYDDPSGLLRLLAEDNTIHTTPVESFSTTTAIPPPVTTEQTPVTTSAFTTTTVTPHTPTSTATAPAFTTPPANISELYFEVQVNVSITGDCDPEQTLSTWLNTSLPDDKMMVLDLQLLTTAQRHRLKRQSNISNKMLVFGVSRESCVFHVQVKMLQSDTQEMEKEIEDLLERPYKIGSVSVATENIVISRIFKFQCDAETHHTRKGVFKWPATSGGKNSTLPCPKPQNCLRSATRHCKICINTHWLDPDMEDCPLVVEIIPDLDHVEVTTENAQDVVDMIDSLLNSHSTLIYDELATVLDKLEAILNLSVLTPVLGQSLINVISDILDSDSNLLPFTNTILNITEAVGDGMMGYEGSASLVAPAVAVSVVDVVPAEFSTLTFGVLSNRVGLKPEIFINRNPLNGTVAFISLPTVLQHNFPESGPNQSHPRVQFQFYGFPGLFKQSCEEGQILNTFVVSASVTNASAPIKDLEDYVKVTLHHLEPNNLYKDVQCVYWNFNLNDGHGGWDGYGCTMFNSTPDYTTCLCDHLTHFGVLLDVSRTEVDLVNKHILTIITYVGCGVSSLFLGVTVLTYTAFEKLRRDYPSQILINLSLALLGLNLMFLVNSWLSSWGLYGLCVAVASTLHYFLLASFTWMGLEAVNMYFALVKVFNVYVPSYILKFCALGWGIPLVICVLVLIVNREAYGSHLYTDTQPSVEPLDNSDNFCWLQDDVAFYVSVVAYAVLVFLFNSAVFVVVLIQIRRMHVNSPAGTHGGLMKDLKGVASLTLLLGLTWTVGFFTWGPARIAMLFLFSGLNSLQGLFIFLFHCLMKENVRKQWRIHLCFGRFRLEEYSEASNSASVGVVAKSKPNPPRASVPSVCSVKSSSTASTSASSDSSQRDSSCKRPGLGLFVNGLVLPRAQISPSAPGAVNSTPGWRNHLVGQHGTG